MTPEQRLDRIERILGLFIGAGRRARGQWRERSREQDEKINILIDTQLRDDAAWRAKSEAINEQIKAVAVAQAELAISQKLTERALVELSESQKLTDKALRAYINSRRQRENGDSST